MNHFVFEGKLKNTLFGFMALGVICMALVWFQDDEFHTRFWTNFLHNAVFFTGISFVALFIWCAKVIAYSGWHTVFKRVWEAAAQFLIVGIVLMGIVAAGVAAGFHHLYHWADAPSVAADAILQHKSSFLNVKWYFLATFGFGLVWYFFARKMRQISLDEDANGDASYSHYKTAKKWAAIFLPIAGFTSAAVIWQWVMSVDAHWYSTLYAWYGTISLLVSLIAITILLLIYLKGKGYYNQVTIEHLHDLAKYMFAFSVFWTYLWFSQFMLIWYGNVGEETTYFNQRMLHYPVLFWGNLFINFVIPFLILIRNDTKRKYGSLAFVAIMVLFGHWLDFFQMIKPGALHTAHELMGEKHGDGHSGSLYNDAKTILISDIQQHQDKATEPVTVKKTTETEHVTKTEEVKTTVESQHNEGEHKAEGTTDHANHEAHGTAEHSEGGHDAHKTAGHGEGHDAHHVGFTPGFTIPGLQEIGFMLGFAALFLFVLLTNLAKASLIPINDPYLEESKHHHVM